MTFQNYVHVFFLKAIGLLLKNTDIPLTMGISKGKLLNYFMLALTAFSGQMHFSNIIKNLGTLNVALPAILATTSFLKGFMVDKIQIQLTNEELKIYSKILKKEIDK